MRPRGRYNFFHWLTWSCFNIKDHLYGNIVILTKFSTLAAPEVVILTTSSAVIDENFIRMTFLFQFITRIRLLWDFLIFMMGIPILVRWCLYYETAPSPLPWPCSFCINLDLDWPWVALTSCDLINDDLWPNSYPWSVFHLLYQVLWQWSWPMREDITYVESFLIGWPHSQCEQRQ